MDFRCDGDLLNAMGARAYKSDLMRLFFSRPNFEALHDGIRYGVFMRSGQRLKVGRQSDTELLIVMQSTFTQHAEHRTVNIHGQVVRLNAIVLEYAIDAVYSEAVHWLKYVDDINRLPVDTIVSETTTTKGDNSLQMFVMEA